MFFGRSNYIRGGVAGLPLHVVPFGTAPAEHHRAALHFKELWYTIRIHERVSVHPHVQLVNVFAQVLASFTCGHCPNAASAPHLCTLSGLVLAYKGGIASSYKPMAQGMETFAG